VGLRKVDERGFVGPIMATSCSEETAMGEEGGPDWVKIPAVQTCYVED